MEDDLRSFLMSNLFLRTSVLQLQEEIGIQISPAKEPHGDIGSERADFLRFEPSLVNEARHMAHYYALFYCIERVTRKLVRDALTEKAGPEWWQASVPEAIRNEVQGRILRELEAGIALRSSEQIDYTTFGELGAIIDKNWDALSDMFENRAATKRVFTALNIARSPIAHNSKFVENEAERFELSISDWERQVKV